MKYLKITFSVICFITITYLAVQVFAMSKVNQKYKKDYAELNHFKYGLFSVDAWKVQLSAIITEEMDKLYLIRKNKKILRKHLEVQLGILIDKVYERIEDKHKKSPLKLTIMDAFIDIEDIKKGIPEYAQAILAQMSSSKTENQIKQLIKERIDHYMKKTFDTKDKADKKKILNRVGLKNETAAKNKLIELIQGNYAYILEYGQIIILLAFVLFIMEGLSKGPLIPVQYFLLTLSLLVMLALGVATPMIDMEAKISNLRFVLLDHPITFDNQIIYFQSKSIWDVFQIMIKHDKPEMKFVGVLLVTFSVVFPAAKMISSFIYYYDIRKVRNSRLIQFFVIRSGKWSMADVLVVAIFMAYIGFNGIINNQLSKLDSETPNLEVISTNGTSLQPGYYIFVAYTIMAMFLSGFIKNRPYKNHSDHL